MNFLLIFLFGTGIVTCVGSNAIHAGDAEENLCPPPENIAPCTCFKDPISKRVTARCSNFTNSYDIKEVFDRNPGWNLQDVWIDQCVMPFLPAKMFQEARFQSMNVSRTTMVTLFDTTPVKTPELNLYLDGVTLQRGFQWSDIASSNLLEMGIWNMKLKSIGQDFKDNIPKGIQRLWFENTGIMSIRNQAFSQLQDLKILALKHGSLKKVSRDMFARPWNVNFWDLSNQRISVLPDDIFDDLPNLAFLDFSDNLLKTISENTFLQPRKIFFSLAGNPFVCNCYMKWIPNYERTETSTILGKCVEPETFKGERFSYLQEADFWYCE